MTETRKNIKWVGDDGAMCFALREHGYGSVVEPGKVYTLPATLAESLAMHKDWKLVGGRVAKAEASPDDDEAPDTGTSESSES